MNVFGLIHQLKISILHVKVAQSFKDELYADTEKFVKG